MDKIEELISKNSIDGYYGVSTEKKVFYQYPKGHPCCGCTFTLKADIPSCMFPKRKDGNCFWYDLKRTKSPVALTILAHKEAAAKISSFIKVLENVMRLKGYK